MFYHHLSISSLVYVRLHSLLYVADFDFYATLACLSILCRLWQDPESASKFFHLSRRKLASSYIVILHDVFENGAVVARPILLIAEGSLEVHATHIFHVFLLLREPVVESHNRLLKFVYRLIKHWVQWKLCFGFTHLFQIGVILTVGVLECRKPEHHFLVIGE